MKTEASSGLESSLSLLSKDPACSKLKHIKDSCETAIDILEDVSKIRSMPVFRLRAMCLSPFEMVLEAKHSKLYGYVLDGISSMIQDPRFISDELEKDEDCQFTNQIISLLQTNCSLPDDVLLGLMKFLLAFFNSKVFSVNSFSLKGIMEICLNAQRTSLQSETRVAIRGTLLQIYSSVCASLIDKSEPDDNDQCYYRGINLLRGDIFETLSHIVRLMEGIQEVSQSIFNIKLGLCLDVLLTSLVSLPLSINQDSRFLDFIWQCLCPALISNLGNPRNLKTVTSAHDKIEEGKLSLSEVGRGSGTSTQPPNIVGTNARIIYSISAELLRHVGCIASMRPVLQSLFHRMLLFPPSNYRLVPLNSLCEIVLNPERLLDICGPTIADEKQSGDNRNRRESDIDLLKLIVDAISESVYSENVHVCSAAVSCVCALLSSLSAISRGEGMKPFQIEEISSWVDSFELMTPDEMSLRTTRRIRLTHHKLSQQYRKPEEIYISQSLDDSTEEIIPLVEIDKPKDRPIKDQSSIEAFGDADKEHTDVHNSGLPECDMDPLPRTTSPDSKVDSEELPIHDLMYGSNDILFDLSAQNDERPSSKTLPDIEIERQALERRVEVEKVAQEKTEDERACARAFVDLLVTKLPSLLTIQSVDEADAAILQLASNFCSDLVKLKETSSSATQTADFSQSVLILNADGVYIAIYYSLLLNLKLIRSKYYENNGGRLPLTQKQFIEEVHESGVLVYLSSTWLSELYKIIIMTDILGLANYSPTNPEFNQALIRLITDIDGMGNLELGGMMLHNSPKTKASLRRRISEDQNPAFVAGLKFCRRILLAVWDSVLEVLAQPLRSKSISGVSCIASVIIEGSKEVTQRDRQAICLSLDGLSNAALLCCSVGVPSLCSSVFLLITNASCSSFQNTDQIVREVKLHASHMLSMDALLNVGLEIGSHCTECWKYVFKCASFIAQLEHSYFTENGDRSLSMVLPTLGAAGDPRGTLSLATDTEQVRIPQGATVADLVKHSRVELGLERSNFIGGGIINSVYAVHVVCSLSTAVDRFFEEAAIHLNLTALLECLRELRLCSQMQLFSRLPSDSDGGIALPSMSSLSQSTGRKRTTALHLFRMGDIVLQCIRSRRPVLHIMRVWSIVAPHFVEAACHKDSQVSKKAVSSIHDILTEILNTAPELAHFNYHEALFKPFESMLRLELCDSDVQDQVICSICELVEACQDNIKSGWRPLFGSLRAVRVQKHSVEDCNALDGSCESATAPVFDVFDAFLNTKNVYVFANAAIDCILCLLKFVRGTAVGEYDPFSEDERPLEVLEPSASAVLCLPALRRLLRCSAILESIYQMPLKPMFRGARSVKLTSRINLDCSDNAAKVDEKPSRTVNVVYGIFMPSDLEQMDDETGIIRVWYLLLEGLTGAVATCPRRYQPQTLSLLFQLLKSVTKIPGPSFGVFSVTHLLLPMLQSWLRKGNCIKGFWEQSVANFRHAIGLSTDLVVEHIINFTKNGLPLNHIPLMLSQLLDLLVECVGHPNESVARLGCSCIKHLLVSAGPAFTEEMWTIASNGLRQAMNISLCFINKLMESFESGSIDFNGDLCQVKVAARTDCTEAECLRLHLLSKQVFLLDSQSHSTSSVAADGDAHMDDQRSFTFIIFPPGVDCGNTNSTTVRVPFRRIVVGLVSHQLILQIIGLLLLSGARSHGTLTEQQILPIDSDDSCVTNFLDHLSIKHVNLLLECLLDSFKFAAEFDARPGLKFLLQKVAKIDTAANLYRQIGASFIFYVHVLIEIYYRNFEEIQNSSIMNILNSEYQSSMENERQLFSSNSTDLNDSEDRGVILEKFRKLKESSDEKQKPPELSFFPNDAKEQDFEWIIKRLFSICNEVCSSYIQIHFDREGDIDLEHIASQPLFILIPDEGEHNAERNRAFSKENSTESYPESNEANSSNDEIFFDSKIYTVATNKTIKNLMKEYKKRKIQHSRSVFVRKPFQEMKPNDEPLDQYRAEQLEINRQQKSSILKDSDARLQAWTEMITGLIQLMQSMDDEMFKEILPLTFPCINQLTCHITDPMVRQAVFDFMLKISNIYQFNFYK